MKRVFVLFAFTLILCPLFFSSCRGQDAFYEDLYNEANAYIYPQRAENFVAMSGYNRILMSWKKPLDPSITKAILYWNSDLDSLIVDVKDPQILEADTIKIALPLEEGTYIFALYNFDSIGNRSTVSESSANVLGDSYVSSFSTRAPKSCQVKDGSIIIQWNTRTSRLVYSEVRYKSVSGERIVQVDAYDTTTVIEDYDFTDSQPIEYRGFYEVKECVDLLYQGWTSIEIPK